MLRLIWFLTVIFSWVANADAIKVATGNFSPYFATEVAPKELGLFDEVISKFAAKSGHGIEFYHVSNDAIKRYFKVKKVDIAVNWTGTYAGSGFPSSYKLYFFNRVITRKNSRWSFARTVDDLTKARIASFPGAKGNFGSDYRNVVTRSDTYYFESADQLAINKMLMANKVDIIVGDWLKYVWFLNMVGGSPEEFVALDILTNRGSQIIFHSEALRDEFDKVCASMIANGEMKTLVDNWFTRQNLPAVSHSFLALN